VTGTNAVQGLDAGWYVVTATAFGYHADVPSAAPSGALAGTAVQLTDTTADLGATVTLSVDPVAFTVTVNDQNGTNVVGLGNSAVTLLVNGAPVGSAATETDSGSPVTAEYVFSAALPGSYTLQVKADGYITYTNQVNLALGAGTAAFTASITQGANLVSGSTQGVQNADPANTPLAATTVCVVASSASSPTCATDAAKGTDGSPLRRTTGAAGTFSFNTVPDGSYVLRAERYGYTATNGSAVTYLHTQASPAPVTLTLPRVTQQVTITVTASSNTDDISGASAAALASAGAAPLPQNGTQSNLSILASSSTGGSVKDVLTVSTPQLPYGCWTFSFTNAPNHYGTAAMTSAPPTDAGLACPAGSFTVPGVGSAAVTVGYTLTEYQPSIKIKTSALPADSNVPGTVGLTVSTGATDYTDASFAVSSSATAIPVWIAGSQTVTATVALPGWSASAPVTVTSGASTASFTLTEVGGTVTVTITKAGAALTGGSSASVTLVVPSGSTGLSWTQSGTAKVNNGAVTFSGVPYGAGWTASATPNATLGSSPLTSTAFTSGATTAAVTIDFP
jgi:hypothetical protein